MEKEGLHKYRKVNNEQAERTFLHPLLHESVLLRVNLNARGVLPFLDVGLPEVRPLPARCYRLVPGAVPGNANVSPEKEPHDVCDLRSDNHYGRIYNFK